jgi:hypothetical protein
MQVAHVLDQSRGDRGRSLRRIRDVADLPKHFLDASPLLREGAIVPLPPPNSEVEAADTQWCEMTTDDD